MEVFAAPVFDENAAPLELRGGKAFGGGGALRGLATPAPKGLGAGGGDASARRAFGDISNKGLGAATGPGKLAAATPRRALGDITNAAAAPAATAAKPAAKPATFCLPPGCSARTASFVTEEVLAQAAAWAVEGTEALAGPSGREQEDAERAEGAAHALARAARMLAADAHSFSADAGGHETVRCRASGHTIAHARPR
jgi:hypothetical protein